MVRPEPSLGGKCCLGCHCAYDQGKGDRDGNKWAEELLEANNIAFDILNSDRTPTYDDMLEATPGLPGGRSM
jgi:hypothetical protein